MDGRFRLWKITIPAVLLVMLGMGCGVSDVERSSPPPVLLSLSVTPVNPSVAPGTTRQFTAIGTYSDNRQRNITASVVWISSDAAIATISNVPGSQGLAAATANTASSAIITAASGGVSGSTTLAISPVATIAVTPYTASIAPGTTGQFAASGILEDGTIQELTSWATWSSSDTIVASVSNSPGFMGLATALTAPGTAAIEAAFGGVTGSAALTTSPVASIALTPATASIPKGTTRQFAASGALLNGTIQDLTSWATWSSSNSTVASVSNAAGSKGLTTANAVGTSNITADFNSVTSPAAALSVTPAVLISIAVTPATQSIALGKTVQYIATGAFSDATTLDITSSATWSSSNTGVASISNTPGSKGLAASLSQGTTTIGATLSGITSNSAVLTVTPATLVTITIAPASADVAPGGTRQFTASGAFTDGTSLDVTASVTWVSSNSTIATISNAPGSQGLATASFFNLGSVNITASLSSIISNAARMTVSFL